MSPRFRICSSCRATYEELKLADLVQHVLGEVGAELERDVLDLARGSVSRTVSVYGRKGVRTSSSLSHSARSSSSSSSRGASASTRRHALVNTGSSGRRRLAEPVPGIAGMSGAVAVLFWPRGTAVREAIAESGTSLGDGGFEAWVHSWLGPSALQRW